MILARSSLLRAVLVGGLIAGVFDAIDALIAFKLVLGFDPIPIYQFVASGLLGPAAFSGGLATAMAGLAIHFVIAFGAAGVFVAAAARWPALIERAMPAGAAFGVGVWAFMNFLVIPLSRIPPSPFNLALLLNGVIGHALLVGIPIALVTRAYAHGAWRPGAAAAR
jgi:hypothetical protein